MNISQLVVTAACLVFLLFYFWWERRILKRLSDKIPLRICVTGARGKSSVVRLLTSILREDGVSVLAKTTGSRPALLYPDGSEAGIVRKSPVSILEQKKILKAAVQHSAQAAVLELMSIRPESLWVESHQLLHPHILVLTNFRCDHREHWGDTRKSVVSALETAITPGCVVFLPEEELTPEVQKTAEDRSAKLVLVPPLTTEDLVGMEAGMPFLEFEPNPRLAVAVAQHLGINREKALRSLGRVVSDAGCLEIWRMEEETSDKNWFFASGFAANDPESTQLALKKITQMPAFGRSRILALLNLRSDRGDRTWQWIEAIKQDRFPEIDRIFVTGLHAPAFKSKVRSSSCSPEIHVLKGCAPEEIMEALSAEASGALVVGMGNLVGLGEALVEYCRAKGTTYAL